jgi:hypothetical protein
VQGYKVNVWKNNSWSSWSVKYPGSSFYSSCVNQCNSLVNPVDYGWFDTKLMTLPNGYNIPDQHHSWASNDGSDRTPFCSWFQGSQTDGWPWRGEVLCVDTSANQTGKVWRFAFGWNTQNTADFNGQMNIGNLSRDGQWFAFQSDWYCTLGTSGGTVALCGPPWQPSHAYQLGDYVGAFMTGAVYKVTTAGTSSATAPASSQWCASAGCQITTGTAVLTYQGTSNQSRALFLLKMQ